MGEPTRDQPTNPPRKFCGPQFGVQQVWLTDSNAGLNLEVFRRVEVVGGNVLEGEDDDCIGGEVQVSIYIYI